MTREAPFNVAAVRKRRARAAGRLRDQGLTLRQIAEALGVTHPTVLADLASLPRFPYDDPDEESDDDDDATIRFHG